MRSYEVSTPAEALVYLCECSLATIDSMSMNKRRSKGEFERQVSIAQRTYDWIIEFTPAIKVKVTGRVAQVRNEFDGKVVDYAAALVAQEVARRTALKLNEENRRAYNKGHVPGV